MSNHKINWLKDPKAGNYPAALSYLSLIYDPEVAEATVELLKEAEIVKFKAKDIFRASGLTALSFSNSHVQKNIQKIKDEEEISPILLVRDPTHGKVIVADGWHRLCSIHQINEDADIHCKIV